MTSQNSRGLNYNVVVACNIALTGKKWMLWKMAYFVVRESYCSKAVMVSGIKHWTEGQAGHSICRDKICEVQKELITNMVGRCIHRDWDSAGLIFVNVEAGEKYMGKYGVQTSITAATMSGHGVAFFATIWCYKLVWQHNYNIVIIAIIIILTFLGLSLHLLHTVISPLPNILLCFLL